MKLTKLLKFEIEKNYPVPPPTKDIFPFHKMDVGDSFIVPRDMIDICRQAINSYRFGDSLKKIKIAKGKGVHSILNIHKRFVIRRTDDYTRRCFRIL